jgi:excisionase family DNA binding protein
MPIAQAQSDITPLLLRTREVATLLGVSESQILIWARAGQLRSIRIPGIRAVRFKRDEVENLAAQWCQAGSVEANP